MGGGSGDGQGRTAVTCGDQECVDDGLRAELGGRRGGGEDGRGGVGVLIPGSVGGPGKSKVLLELQRGRVRGRPWNHRGRLLVSHWELLPSLRGRFARSQLCGAPLCLSPSGPSIPSSFVRHLPSRPFPVLSSPDNRGALPDLISPQWKSTFTLSSSCAHSFSGFQFINVTALRRQRRSFIKNNLLKTS